MKPTNDSALFVIFSIAVIILIITFGLLFAFRKRLTKRRICIIAISVTVVVVTALGALLLAFDSVFKRDYQDDLRIELAQNDGVIIVKEWSFLTGSGAEIYYEKDGEVVCLGSTDGNDGYLAFDDGKYTFTEGDGEVTLSWFYSKVSGKEDWRSKTFKLAKD